MHNWWLRMFGRRNWRWSGAVLVSMIGLAALTLGSLGLSARPVPSGPPPFHARRGDRVVLVGTLPRALAHAHRQQREDGTRSLQLTVALKIQHPADLAALILRQQDPTSAQFHKYLSPQAFTDQFGPDPQAVAAVRKFLADAGLRVTAVSANRLLIDASGTVSQAEKAFGITIGQYQLDQRTVFAPDQEPNIPDVLAPAIQGIVGLDNVGVLHPLQQSTLLKPVHPSAGPGGGFTPSDLRNAYDVSSLISAGGDGTGQPIAVFELAPYIPNDVAVFRSQYSLPSSTITNHPIDGAAVTCTSTCNVADIGEADLDVEVVSGLAPNATQDVYTGPNTTQGVLDTYQAIATANTDKVVTTSWGLCEAAAGNSYLVAQDNIFAQAASQGQTVFSAAGDDGSTDCVKSTGSNALAVLSPASDPYVVGVGGTTLTLSNGGGYGSEITWNDLPTHNNPIGTGGGNSSYFGRPSWQVGLNLPNNGVRLVPDVAANADPYTGYSIYCSSTVSFASGGCAGGGWEVWGGTSAAAPLWAGILADINRYLVANSASPTGWVNKALYQLLGSTQTYSTFHDVTSGNNDEGYGSGGFSAGACYDQVTGVGTPDAWNIARDIRGGVNTFGGGPCSVSTGSELIQDGGFETAPGPWHLFSLGGYPGIGPINPHSGSNAFFACGYPGCDDRAWQVLSVPATINTAHLTFWLAASTSLGGDSCLDHFRVTLATPDGTVFDTIEASCASNTGGYVLQPFDVTAALQGHTNQQVIMMFRGAAANVAGSPLSYSGWFVDDVSLTVS